MTQPLEFSLTLYPDPLLRQQALAVTAFDEELRAIVAAMYERMEKSKGVGLAAPQVGLQKRILVLNPTGERKLKSEVHRDGDWHRSSHVWLLSPEGRLLLQRRSEAKVTWPGLWDVSAAGHISAGESAV